MAIVFSIASSAQTSNTKGDSTGSKAQFKLSVNYNSNLNYYGRTDSLKSTGVFPLAELWFTPKFYINAAPIFVNNKVQSFDYAGTVATIGYQNVTDKWISSLYLLKPFYKKSSGLVQSALKAQAGASFSSLNKVLNINFGGDIKLSDKVDFGLSAGLDHLIRIENRDNSVLVIDPSFYAYAGTQNFSNSYIKKSAGSLLFPSSGSRVTENVTRFNVLAYEASVPLIYANGKWMVLFTPSYVIPQNLVTVEGRPDLSERGEKLFYATVGLKYSF